MDVRHEDGREGSPTGGVRGRVSHGPVLLGGGQRSLEVSYRGVVVMGDRFCKVCWASI